MQHQLWSWLWWLHWYPAVSTWSAQVVFHETYSPVKIVDQTMPLNAAQNTPTHIPSTSQTSTESSRDNLFRDNCTLTHWSSIFRLNDIDAEIVCHKSGYIAKQVNCSQKAYKISSINEKKCQDAFKAKHVYFVSLKNFSWAKYGPTFPSQSMLCQSMEKIVQTNCTKHWRTCHVVTLRVCYPGT